MQESNIRLMLNSSVCKVPWLRITSVFSTCILCGRQGFSPPETLNHSWKAKIWGILFIHILSMPSSTLCPTSAENIIRGENVTMLHTCSIKELITLTISKTLHYSQTKIELLVHSALHFLWNIIQTRAYLTGPGNNFQLQISLKRPFVEKNYALKKMSVRKLIIYSKNLGNVTKVQSVCTGS